MKQLIPNKDLVFGKYFTDHMLTCEYEDGWKSPQIRKYAPISLEPCASVFHYGMECFEGMKAYKDTQGRIRLFRPDMNMTRFLSSATRLSLPSFDGREVMECLKELIRVEERWIPSERGFSLYIRPTFIATQQSLGVGASSRALLFVICSPVGPYYKTGFNAVSLIADPQFIRAWPGGVGNYKIGGNYAPGILPQINAAKQNFQQNLWLFPDGKGDHFITEVGTMNCCVYWVNEKGERELVTPPLDSTILPGVTRDSILSLARTWNEFKVREAPVLMSELIRASKEGRLLEMFGCGTACIVAPIKQIRFVKSASEFVDITVPLDPSRPSSQAGPLAQRFSDAILGIQYGESKHPWSVVL